MFEKLNRRRFLGAALLTVAGGPVLLAQNSAERKVDPLDLPLDKPGVWTLHFRYKPPRIDTFMALDAKGNKVKKTVWYMWFQVYNAPTKFKLPNGETELRAADPVTFLPEFELVTKDLNTTHLDDPEPFVVDQIKKKEDETGVLNLQTSISISKRPVPPSMPDAIPKMVSGVAVWTDMAERAPRTNRFSVYISGLSNGLAAEQLPSGELLIRRKTLQINFIRPTDDARPEITDIKPDDATGPAEKWIYRTSSKVTPALKGVKLPAGFGDTKKPQ
jgi:hypothetical protein